jgi:hypothetical protein
MARLSALLLVSAMPFSLALTQWPGQFSDSMVNNDAVDTLNQAVIREAFSKRLHEAAAITRAKTFDGEQCVAKKKGADLKAWARSNVDAPGTVQRSRTTRTLVTPSGEVAYVRNCKAGSSFLYAHFTDIFHVEKKKMGNMPLKFYDGSEDSSQAPQWGEDRFVFTVIREPMVTALDAYLEVSIRSTKLASPTPAFASMPCRTRDEATARFKKYLQDALNGTKISSDFFHSFPQALKIDADLRGSRAGTFDSIVKIETMLDDLQTIPGFVGSTPDRDRDHSHSEDPCGDVDMQDPRLMAILCRMYRVDYECFDYKLPAACKP